ncbi:MAG: YHYH protein [Hyphomonadaceae bacterium]
MKHLTIAFAAAALLAAPIAVAHEAPESIELPVGDGHVTDHPATGNVYSCQTAFRGGGAMHVGEWFHGDTWNPAEKPHVEGRVMWPNAEFELSQRGDVLGVSGNSLPVEQPTGTFPISPNDPVFRYDRNPNPIEEVALAFEIPAAPVRAASPSCLPMGMIGFTLTGVAIYNALDAAGRDAAAHEVQDLCDGHPQGRGQYHYHSASPCLPAPATTPSLAGRSTATQSSACETRAARSSSTQISMTAMAAQRPSTSAAATMITPTG